MEEMEHYNRCVEQEDRYDEQLDTLESCQYAIFDHIYRYGERFDKLAVENVLIAIHQLEDAVRLELLHVRLEKAYLAYGLKPNKPKAD
ncbi:hypothetical protein PAESOLCIP111_05547 [Paenibacillus solanacearum]|uniref:Uncharacterized protein n=1 Tax=Paenibacillus solanacearum TaxID=2048548 RepID=A0A916K6C0_9BACL|nr:hypothetical protein [Paenibacillus solanacearum]CAG7648186.1 hypothetical protein PAESOLCIP111_05547 [Paenibacillus solanacearum]